MKEFYDEHGIGYKWIGSPDGLPTNLVEFFYEQERRYPSRGGKYMIVAVNYGGNDEILRGINNFLSSHPDAHSITQEQLSESMDLAHFPPIELVIRTK